MTEIFVPKADLWERKLLWAIQRENSLIFQAASRLTENDFRVHGHARLFAMFLQLAERGKQFDFTSIWDALQTSQKINSIGGIQVLLDIQDAVGQSSGVERYCEEILVASRHRKLIHLLEHKLDESLSPDSNPNQIIAELQQATIGMTHLENQQSVAETAKSVLQKINDIRSGKRKAGGISTSIHPLDVITAGIKPAEYIVIAGRTGQGKSTLARQIVQNAARIGHHPLICSPEMTRENIIECMAASVAEVPYDLVQDPCYLKAEQYDNLQKAISIISELPFDVDDSSGVDIAEMCARIRAKIMRGVDLVVVDYLQMLRVKGADSDYDRVTKASAALRDLAKTTRVPIVALSQLRRAGSGADEPPPTIYDLKESGNIENDAFQVWLIYRPKEGQRYTGEDEIRVGKNRNGPCDTIPVYCDAPLLKFKERSTR